MPLSPPPRRPSERGTPHSALPVLHLRYIVRLETQNGSLRARLIAAQRENEAVRARLEGEAALRDRHLEEERAQHERALSRYRTVLQEFEYALFRAREMYGRLHTAYECLLDRIPEGVVLPPRLLNLPPDLPPDPQ